MNNLRQLYRSNVLLSNYLCVRQYGVFGNILKRFRGKKESDEQFFVGEDQHGNRYYEKQPSPDASVRITRRWIKYYGVTDEDIQKEEIPFVPADAEIPVEWKSWLQKKRKSPPLIEEILKNEAIKLRTIQRAKELEEKERALSGSGSVPSSPNPFKDEEFPVYPEYETKIGEYRSDYLTPDKEHKKSKNR
ncbi:NADH dehydrogenase [ubiquinone] 1 alpha subcomplex assembly factor 2-like [Saccostrea echinata]|uniref:NADH dehydrogenase [ubiquinone] 1 alpha subcomplex assembly factor 2-like n=1 Tax=Saccostrea echinata TaxID=191078 RepID=UPI002A7F6DFA|nr:NADH dehydrogenase [ubiquinone] 1 alpha subcomplex assembly factor 2-like [Saccostrea echinata]